MKKVLICGATGFIGRNALERLSQRDDMAVTGVYHVAEPFDCPGADWVQADLTRIDDVERVIDGFDIVIQGAAVTSGAADIVARPHIHIADNAIMNSLIFRAAFEAGLGHLMFYSCSIMYPSSDSPLKESDFTGQVHDNYFGGAWNKIYLEKMCQFYAGLGGTKFTALRHSNIYGPHDKYDLQRSHMFGATVTKVMTAPDGGDIVVWGEGTEGRDLLYVDDLNDAVLAALDNQKDAFGLYNIGAGVAVSVAGVVEEIITASGRDLTMVFDTDKPTIKTTLCLDCTKAADDLGWTAKTPLKQGIGLTIEWYKNNILRV
ncbi:MAG: NAD-dependent epimerase/dehydratase family protein [Alphaproteobacteria bacterium]